MTDSEKSVFDIDYLKYFNGGVKLIIFDIDDTLSAYKEEFPDNSIELLKRLSQNFKIVFFSNCSSARRDYLMKIGKQLDIYAVNNSYKPNCGEYVRLFKRFNVSGKDVLVIGDRVGIDLLGAHGANVSNRTLVEPYSEIFGGINHPSYLRFLRYIEKKFLL